MSDVAHADHGHAEHPKVPYFLIAGALFVMTVITIAVSYVNLGKMGNVALALFVASIKASLVMLFFMHLKYERKTLIIISLVPYGLALILLLALFPDIVFG
ncbi:MAG TPA: cytochrome C oxidase subunit IV family protein [Planctomycetota bacterium]|nr:cytochrome C oxidase subunit IV family protein [Planctomycetota bacterium]